MTDANAKHVVFRCQTAKPPYGRRAFPNAESQVTLLQGLARTVDYYPAEPLFWGILVQSPETRETGRAAQRTLHQTNSHELRSKPPAKAVLRVAVTPVATTADWLATMKAGRMAIPDENTVNESSAERLGAFLPMYWAADLCITHLRLLVDVKDRVLGGTPSCTEEDYADSGLRDQTDLERFRSLVNYICWEVKAGLKLSMATRAKLTEVSGKTVKALGVLATNAHEAAITLGAHSIEQIARVTGAYSEPVDPVRLRNSITTQNLVEACRSLGHLNSEVAELAIEIRREFILVRGDASWTGFSPGWIQEPDETPSIVAENSPKETESTRDSESHLVDWQNDAYYFVYQTFFDQGRVFARLKGLTIVEASKIWSALTVVRPQGGPGGLIRMISEKTPHLHLPSAEELESGVTDSSGNLIIQRHQGLRIGMPIPADEFSARIWLRKGWSRFRKKLSNKNCEWDDIDRYMRRLYRLFRKLRKQVITEMPPNCGRVDVQSDMLVETSPLESNEREDSPTFPSLLPESQEVRDLCRKLQKELPEGRSQIVIARELTGESEGDDRKAKSLLRQARRFSHLWKKSSR